MPETANMNRRDFLRLSAAGAVALGLGAQGVLAPSRVLGANERINIAVIGVGGRGSGLLGELLDKAKSGKWNLQVIGVCDVWDVRTNRAKGRVGPDCKGSRDYREILRLRDLDAVVIATPDHWHSKMSVDALRAGKDVYCEKPMTLYWEQAKEVAQVAKETKRVFQCGAGSASDGRWWTARDIITQGGIGPLVWSQAGVFRNDPGGDWNWGIQPADPKKDLDWDLWLGHEFGLAPKRPYDPERFSRFRKYWDYSGGLATDLIYHAYAHLLIGLGLEFPMRVVGSGGNPVHNLQNDSREVPTLFNILVDFATQHSAFLMSTQENNAGFGDVVRGQKATLEPGGPGVVVRPQEPFRGEMLELARTLDCYQGAEVITEKDGQGRERLGEIRVRSKYGWDHVGMWLDCIHSRQQPTLNADNAYRVMVPIALSVRSYREGKVMFFDPGKEQVTA